MISSTIALLGIGSMNGIPRIDVGDDNDDGVNDGDYHDDEDGGDGDDNDGDDDGDDRDRAMMMILMMYETQCVILFGTHLRPQISG